MIGRYGDVICCVRMTFKCLPLRVPHFVPPRRSTFNARLLAHCLPHHFRHNQFRSPRHRIEIFPVDLVHRVSSTYSAWGKRGPWSQAQFSTERSRWGDTGPARGMSKIHSMADDRGGASRRAGVSVSRGAVHQDEIAIPGRSACGGAIASLQSAHGEVLCVLGAEVHSVPLQKTSQRTARGGGGGVLMWLGIGASWKASGCGPRTSISNSGL